MRPAEAEAGERHASWLELFFDLLFVAIVSQLAHGLVGHATALRVLQVGGLFLLTWWVWCRSRTSRTPASAKAQRTGSACWR